MYLLTLLIPFFAIFGLKLFPKKYDKAKKYFIIIGCAIILGVIVVSTNLHIVIKQINMATDIPKESIQVAILKCVSPFVSVFIIYFSFAMHYIVLRRKKS
jgi:uncharacterized BrkB/YihY/UPF0761 family membrane protein